MPISDDIPNPPANDDQEMNALIRLEGYLDGDLSPNEAQHVQNEVQRQSALAQALSGLRAARQQRQSVWQSLEPSDAVADQFAATVLARAWANEPPVPVRVPAIQAREESPWPGRLRRLAAPSAVAAGLLLAFSGGWLAHGRIAARSPANRAASGSPIVQVTPSTPIVPAIAAVPANSADSAHSRVQTVVAYQVALTDEAGRIVAVQQFDGLEKARAFVADWDRWQRRQQQAHNASTAVVIADRF